MTFDKLGDLDDGEIPELPPYRYDGDPQSWPSPPSTPPLDWTIPARTKAAPSKENEEWKKFRRAPDPYECPRCGAPLPCKYHP